MLRSAGSRASEYGTSKLADKKECKSTTGETVPEGGTHEYWAWASTILHAPCARLWEADSLIFWILSGCLASAITKHGLRGLICIDSKLSAFWQMKCSSGDDDRRHLDTAYRTDDAPGERGSARTQSKRVSAD